MTVLTQADSFTVKNVSVLQLKKSTIHLIFNLRADVAICNFNVQDFSCHPLKVLLAVQKFYC